MWSPQQAQALDSVGRWLKTKSKPVYQLAGFAGTGKTTLAKHLVESVEGRVYFAAFTGKAAHVLMKSGAKNVSTIHKLIYQPKDRSQKRLKELEAERATLRTHKPLPETLLAKIEIAIKKEQENLTRPLFQLNLDSELNGAALLVVDEYSMIDAQMGADLLTFGCPILALGDPAQLPPVKGRGWLDGKPDTLLTEIHRQASDNPIIWLSREVREGRSLKPGKYGESVVESHESAKNLGGRVLAADQLLVGRNATRLSSNIRARSLLGFSQDLPMEKDKLVCLRNNSEFGLLNGQMWTVDESTFDGAFCYLKLKGEDAEPLTVSAHADYFRGGKPDHWTRRDAEEFDYGYALTVHKSQGSAFESVMLFDEWYREDRRQWLYTAITRAVKKIDIIQM